MVGDIVVIVNRTNRNLDVMKDGKPTVLKPGRNSVNAGLIRFAKQQNPLPGSQDPYTLQEESLIGVEGTHDNCEPIPDELLALLPIEKIDRTSPNMPPDRRRVTEKATGFPKGRSRATSLQDPSPGMTEFAVGNPRD